jgi:hypothetical protein
MLSPVCATFSALLDLLHLTAKFVQAEGHKFRSCRLRNSLMASSKLVSLKTFQHLEVYCVVCFIEMRFESVYSFI